MWWAFPLTLWRSLFSHKNTHLLFRSFLNEAVRFFILLRCINIVLTLKFKWHYGIERNIIVSVSEKPKFESFMYRSNRDINILPGIPWEFDKRMYRGRSVTSVVDGGGTEGKLIPYGKDGKGNLNKLSRNHIEARRQKGTIQFFCKRVR